MERQIVLFDGECRLCTRTVEYLRRWDKKKVLDFVPIQSETAQTFFERSGITEGKMGGIWFVLDFGGVGERFFQRSDAILAIFGCLGGFWRVMVVGYWLPRGVREWIYGVIAENRYRWFGKNGCIF